MMPIVKAEKTISNFEDLAEELDSKVSDEKDEWYMSRREIVRTAIEIIRDAAEEKFGDKDEG